MSNHSISPWNFPNDAPGMTSPDGQYKVEYGPLYEIAMGGPLSGECRILMPDQTSLNLPDVYGGPPVWEGGSHQLAIPLWMEDRTQRLAVVDVVQKKLTIFIATFSVLELIYFDKNIIVICDSPIHLSRKVVFDIEKERIKQIKKLGTI